MSSIGPELPPHLLAKRKRQAEEAQTSTHSPTLGKNVSSTSSPDAAEKRRRVMGPAPPPAPLAELPQTSANDDGSSSSDDEFGPSLPTGNTTTVSLYSRTLSLLTAQSYAHDSDESPGPKPAPTAPKKVERDAWMLVPPKQDDLAARMDPTKIRAKKFNTGRAAGASAGGGGIDTVWTETPEQKRKRLENEVLGVAAPAHSTAKQVKPRAKDEEETARRIKEHTEKHRGKSLYDQHQKSTPQDLEDDPSKRAFDREKDIASGTRIGHTQRKDLVNRAADFGSRFSGGGYL
ncbi:hypothetical protein EJ06DRAFT_297612 [Trichodelitschia bisporula]|uniref:DUF3752 domain-containing protein n=1 Tax=Trichodelitschia bisporula TaxID=703511 RepID=A0A6G1I6F0_9PEZI|nr:hypothetical protein EJ06DRAFT_297612 [Trichodelitschia bisporula]